MRPNFNIKIPPVSGRDRPDDTNVLSMASLIVKRRHCNSKSGDRDRSSDQENNEAVNISTLKSNLAPNLDVPKLKLATEYKSNSRVEL